MRGCHGRDCMVVGFTSNVVSSNLAQTKCTRCSNTPVSSTNKTDCHDITKILLKVVLSTINHKPKPKSQDQLKPNLVEMVIGQIMYFVLMEKRPHSVYFSTSFDDLYLYPAYNSMGHIVFLFVHSSVPLHFVNATPLRSLVQQHSCLVMMCT